MSRCFGYSNKEIEYLKSRDPVLGKYIDTVGMIKRQTDPDIFKSLISSIISQQISIKAALTVEEKFINLVGKVNPNNINKVDVEAIQQCGMSLRKAGYIKGIAEDAINKTVDFDNLVNLSDEEVIKELIKLKGVGEWTAQMLLIHSLERPDVVSFKDLAIRRGMMKLYNLSTLSLEEFYEYKKKYSPYGTVASLYLWHISK
ncbi:MAG: DNA-3-methyladenine glycosylase 2 family protein [Bacilli bacterium]